jgi:hypothetical protein
MPERIKLRGPFAEAADRLSAQKDQISPVVGTLLASAQLVADRRARGEPRFPEPDPALETPNSTQLLGLADEVLSYLEYGEGLPALSEELRARVEGLRQTIENGGLEDPRPLSRADLATAVTAKRDLDELREFFAGIFDLGGVLLQPRSAADLFVEVLKRIYAEVEDATALASASPGEQS